MSWVGTTRGLRRLLSGTYRVAGIGTAFADQSTVLGSSNRDPLLGRTLGNYVLTRLIDSGAVGSVYEAEHPVLRRHVAIKVLRADLCRDTELVERFFNEARIASTIRHAGIVEVHDLGRTEDGRPYVMMELVPGRSLAHVLDVYPTVDPRTAAQIGARVADALAAAHKRGVIHRDVKPGNILLSRGAVKMVDFGVAKLRGTDLTKVGTTVGTPDYMAPEQISGSARLDGRADVYSLGVVLFEMVTGKRPFPGRSFNQILSGHLNDAPPKPTDLNPTVPPKLEGIILRALAKNPNERFASAAEMRQALLGAIGSPCQATRDCTTKREPATARVTARRPRLSARIGAAVAGAVLMLGLIVGASAAVERVTDQPTERVVVHRSDLSTRGL